MTIRFLFFACCIAEFKLLDEDREIVRTDISHGRRTAAIVIEADFNEKRYEDEIILLAWADSA